MNLAIYGNYMQEANKNILFIEGNTSQFIIFA